MFRCAPTRAYVDSGSDTCCTLAAWHAGFCKWQADSAVRAQLECKAHVRKQIGLVRILVLDASVDDHHATLWLDDGGVSPSGAGGVPTLMTSALPANSAAERGLKMLWKG